LQNEIPKVDDRQPISKLMERLRSRQNNQGSTNQLEPYTDNLKPQGSYFYSRNNS